MYTGPLERFWGLSLAQSSQATYMHIPGGGASGSV